MSVTDNISETYLDAYELPKLYALENKKETH